MVITRDTDTLLTDKSSMFDPTLTNDQGDAACDHLMIAFSDNMSKTHNQRQKVTYRRLKDICVNDVIHDLTQCQSLQDTSRRLDELVTVYNDSLTSLIDTHTPLSPRILPSDPMHHGTLRN